MKTSYRRRKLDVEKKRGLQSREKKEWVKFPSHGRGQRSWGWPARRKAFKRKMSASREKGFWGEGGRIYNGKGKLQGTESEF